MKQDANRFEESSAPRSLRTADTRTGTHLNQEHGGAGLPIAQKI